MATTTEAKPTTSDRRVPYMIEESTSRPWSSVPSGNAHSPSDDSSTGGFSPSLRLSVAGSNGVCGASTGARKAITTMNRGAAAAATVIDHGLEVHQMSLSAARSSPFTKAERATTPMPAGTHQAGATQARVDGKIKEIHREVDQYEQQPDHHQVGCHNRDVGELHRLDEQLAHARPGEHGLGDDGERDQRAELQTGHGD